MTRINYALCLLALLAFALAGCGGGDSTSGGAYSGNGGGASGSGDATGSAESAEPEGGVVGVLSVAKVGDLGSILIDRGLHTVYVFHKDKGSTSSCYGACAESWFPIITEIEPIAKKGVDAEKLGTTERKDGTMQVTYDGRPLYTYIGDKASGEANGNDIDQFGAEWYALQPNGEEPED